MIVARMGKYGPIVSLLPRDNTDDKIKYAPLKIKTIEEITLKEAIALLRYPREIGKFNKLPIKMCKGEYGLYLSWDKIKVSIKDLDEEEEKEFTLEEGIEFIKKKMKYKSQEKTFGKDYVLKNGQYGYYLVWKSKVNISVPKKIDIKTLNEKICNKIRIDYEQWKKKSSKLLKKK